MIACSNNRETFCLHLNKRFFFLLIIWLHKLKVTQGFFHKNFREYWRIFSVNLKNIHFFLSVLFTPAALLKLMALVLNDCNVLKLWFGIELVWNIIRRIFVPPSYSKPYQFWIFSHLWAELSVRYCCLCHQNDCRGGRSWPQKPPLAWKWAHCAASGQGLWPQSGLHTQWHGLFVRTDKANRSCRSHCGRALKGHEPAALPTSTFKMKAASINLVYVCRPEIKKTPTQTSLKVRQ